MGLPATHRVELHAVHAGPLSSTATVHSVGRTDLRPVLLSFELYAPEPNRWYIMDLGFSSDLRGIGDRLRNPR